MSCVQKDTDDKQASKSVFKEDPVDMSHHGVLISIIMSRRLDLSMMMMSTPGCHILGQHSGPYNELCHDEAST